MKELFLSVLCSSMLQEKITELLKDSNNGKWIAEEEKCIKISKSECFKYRGWRSSFVYLTKVALCGDGVSACKYRKCTVVIRVHRGKLTTNKIIKRHSSIKNFSFIWPIWFANNSTRIKKSVENLTLTCSSNACSRQHARPFSPIKTKPIQSRFWLSDISLGFHYCVE